eukprot:TRINITY_DN71276_c0_g1_i1.p1 TRINITY_DN71276_c0_g1~~TRINITY_DN71276_c0_g1_i1.p1  ORF type:complete len:343 (-),score=55.93 TRINITY_DN71276_c0_g1_i1:286-1314(-)
MSGMDLGGLNLALETDANDLGAQNSTWSVSADGSLWHNATGILIGELGLRDGQTAFTVDSSDIEVDQTNVLGRGAGGVVARGVHKPTNTALAIKVVRVEDKSKRSQLINDLHTLLRISKSNFLIQLYAAYVHKDTGCVHVALEYMDLGSLHDLKQLVPLVPESILALIMMQILEGLKILHLSHVVHRDVKLGNILVNSKGCVKVTDFGISKKLGDFPGICETFVGTATHMSPERVLGDGYSFAADIWSLGLCVYELASGTYPYGNVASFPVLFDNLCNKPEPQLQPGRFSEHLCDFVKCQLKRRPEMRATAIQLQAHPYILSNLSQVTQRDLVQWLRGVVRD